MHININNLVYFQKQDIFKIFIIKLRAVSFCTSRYLLMFDSVTDILIITHVSMFSSLLYHILRPFPQKVTPYICNRMSRDTFHNGCVLTVRYFELSKFSVGSC